MRAAARIGYDSIMGKSTRTPILAAGGIVIRNGAKPVLAVVQRRRDNAWVLPKGKLKPGEKPIDAARREATEETGSDVRVHDFLGVISYIGGSGPKIAHFWRMQAIGGTAGKPMDDIKAVEWLSLSAAIERLSLPHEQSFLRNVGRKALKKTLKKTRAKRPADEAVTPAVEILPPHRDDLPARAQVAPVILRGKLAKTQPHWPVLMRLRKSWQAAVGRTRRTG
jgi:8-oxo-dGTP diphosphatase